MKKALILLVLMSSLLAIYAACAQEPDFDFVVLGDSRVAFQGAPVPEAYKKILQEVNLINPDLVIHTGDLVYGYGDSPEQLKLEYSGIENLLKTVTPRIYFVPGNHDFQNRMTTEYFLKTTDQIVDHFTVVQKGVHFIILNTDQPGYVGQIGGVQMLWLEKELEAAKDARAVFVFMHRPLFSWLIPDANNKGNRPEATYNFVTEEARTVLLNLFTKYKVTAVFAGHEHLYYRTDYNGIPFITLGGAGATFSAPPDKGGFFSYMIISVKGKDIKYGLMTPYQFAVDVSTFESKGRVYGQAIINNIHGELFEGVIPLHGIKFTLPKGQYKVKADSLVAPSQIVKIAEAVGTIPKKGTVMEKVREAQVKLMLLRLLKPVITKTETNKEDPKMVDVWVSFDAPGTISTKLTLSPVVKK